jgi:hypothetical protein
LFGALINKSSSMIGAKGSRSEPKSGEEDGLRVRVPMPLATWLQLILSSPRLI